MIDVKNLTITSRTGRVLIKDLSFSLNGGDKIAIIGEEGNGKTTLLKALVNKHKLPHDFIVKSGQIVCQGVVGYLEQFLDENWDKYSVMDFFLKEAPESDISYEIFEKYNKLVNQARELGFDENKFESEQKIKTLSGGEKIKLQLIKILLKEPDYLLLDEPTNDLDIETLEWLEEFIKTRKQGILFVSHDEMLLEKTANGILHLEQIKKKTEPRWSFAKLGYKEYIEDRINRFEKQDQIAKDERDERRAAEKITAEIKSKIQSSNPERTNSMRAIIAREERWKREKLTEFVDSEDAIKIKINEKLELPRQKVVLDLHLKELFIENKKLSENIDLSVTGPEKIVIIGKNGTGKTTLLKQIYDHLKNNSVGLVPFYMPQNYSEVMNLNQTPLELISEGKSKDDITIARIVLNRLKLTNDEINANISKLSGGQKAKLYLANMILSQSNVLILDEPTRNLSPLTNPVIRSLLNSFGGSIISVSHDRKFIESIFDKVYELTSSGLVNRTDFFFQNETIR